jgi:hypothetical protein
MTKYVFWSILKGNRLIAMDERLDRYAAGETFWQALGALLAAHPDIAPSGSSGESDPGMRLRMYQETGLNKVEIFIEKDGGRYAVRSANSRSLTAESTESAALLRFIEIRAKTSLVNTGEA